MQERCGSGGIPLLLLHYAPPPLLLPLSLSALGAFPLLDGANNTAPRSVTIPFLPNALTLNSLIRSFHCNCSTTQKNSLNSLNFPIVVPSIW